MDDDSFETLVVLQFAPETPAKTKEWVLKKITGDRDNDEGAGFLARFDPDCGALLIGATIDRLLIGAEEFRIKKWHKEKELQEFLVSDKENFENSSKDRISMTFCLSYLFLIDRSDRKSSGHFVDIRKTTNHLGRIATSPSVF